MRYSPTTPKESKISPDVNINKMKIDSQPWVNFPMKKYRYNRKLVENIEIKKRANPM
jgi:hypothetical protein